MKKYIALILICALTLSLLPALAEDAALAGDWYADLEGVPAQLTLGADGTYTLAVTGKETKTGVWALREGFLYMDGSAAPGLYPVGDLLRLADAPVFFTREKPAFYTPAEPRALEDADDFAGYWKSVYVDLQGTAVPAYTMKDETDLYVEGTSAILGGPMLGDTPVKLAFENGELTADNEGVKTRMQLQADGFLRLTVTGTETAPQTWYLSRAYSPALEAEEEAPAEPAE